MTKRSNRAEKDASGGEIKYHPLPQYQVLHRAGYKVNFDLRTSVIIHVLENCKTLSTILRLLSSFWKILLV